MTLINIDLRNGDCLELLKTLPNNSVDLIITSPPYNLAHSHRKDFLACVKYNTYTDDLEYDDYINWQIEVLDECYRVLKDTGVMYYNHKERHINNFYFNPLQILLKTKFTILQTIIWDRLTGMGFNKYRFVNRYESIYVCYKTKKYMRINRDYEGLWDIWQFPRNHKALQPATFPLELPLRIINSYDYKDSLVVLDPFMGSGTTGVASKKLNRDFIGFELDTQYFENAKRRIDDEQ